MQRTDVVTSMPAAPHTGTYGYWTGSDRLIASARMYEVTERAKSAWRELFSWLADEARVPLERFDYPPPAPLEDLWSRSDMGCVFMCGWPFVRAVPRPWVVAVPIPADERYRGRAIYYTDLVVRRDRGFRRLEDTFGGRLAWTAEGSHSGFNALRYHLLQYRSTLRPGLYRETVGPLQTPAGSLMSVVEGGADVAPLDSYALDLIATHEPDRVAEIAVIESTVAAPAPLLVAAPHTDPGAVSRMREVLAKAGEAAEMTPVLDELLLKGFELPAPGAYKIIAERAAACIAADYPKPA